MKIPKIDDCIISPKSKLGYVYDVETYPNFFCVSFYNGRDHIQFEISSRKNQLQEIIEFIKNKVLIGYNNSKFDDLIINYLLQEEVYLKRFKGEEIAKGLFSIAGMVINYYQSGSKDETIKKLKYLDKPYTSLDLMKIGNIQKGLKLVGVSLKWHNIQDLPFKWDIPLETEEQMDFVMSYNRNDTEMTLLLTHKLEKEIELRVNLSKLYEVDVLSESDSGIGNILFEKMYKEKAVQKNFSDLRTHRSVVHLSDCIFDDIRFETRQLTKVLNDLKAISIPKGEKGFKISVPAIDFNNARYQLGVGGIHSEDEAGIFESSDDLFIIDSDVTSYYPSMIINKKVKPAHLEDCFVQVMYDITQERVAGKKAGDTVKADGLKIVINSAFGKLGFEGSYLYDEQALLTVTLNGQLYLLMLIEMLTGKNFQVISANTDGIITLVPKDRKEEYDSICTDWQNKTKLNLEYTFYRKYVRKDVNNYIAKTINDKIKSKGCFLQDIDIKKGFDAPVVNFVLKKYYMDGLPLEKSLMEHKDIYDFCIAQKMGGQFEAEYGGQSVQKSVRFYVCKSGKKLLKWKTNEDGSKSSTDLCVGKSVQLFNQFEQREDYNIDYDYYLRELRKITGELNKAEETLW